MLYKQTQFGRRGAGRPKAGYAKQIQFPAGQDTPPFHYSIILPFGSGAYRAKQSQFRPSDTKDKYLLGQEL